MPRSLYKISLASKTTISYLLKTLLAIKKINQKFSEKWIFELLKNYYEL